MIEQVFYGREGTRGYTSRFSSGLSESEANEVIGIMDKFGKNINAGTDASFLIYPLYSSQDTIKRVCLARLSSTTQGGRSTLIYHGLLIDTDEYMDRSRDPKQIFGFTNKNFQSTCRGNEMPPLNSLGVSYDIGFDKDDIFREYNIKNEGYLKFLTTVYTALSKNTRTTFAIQIGNLKDRNKVMRHFGYLIMSMLPYDLRSKASFFSRSASNSIGVTFQIIDANDRNESDVVYEISTGECLVNRSGIETIDFYLNDLLYMSDSELSCYFSNMDRFKGELKLSRYNDTPSYTVSKLSKLSHDPSMFSSETSENQITFIRDLLSLETKNDELINNMLVRLLPFANHQNHMDIFQINFELYKRLNIKKEYNRENIRSITENIILNYRNSTSEERVQIFDLLYDYAFDDRGVQIILENLVEINEIESDKVLVDKYLKLYDQAYDTDWKSCLYKKIKAVFKEGDIAQKNEIWSSVYKSTDSVAKDTFIYKILDDKDESFCKSIFNDLLLLYTKAKIPGLRARLYNCISVVIENMPVKELEDHVTFEQIYESDNMVTDKIISVLKRNREKISVESLKQLACNIDDDQVETLADYIRDLYLSDSSVDANEIYSFLENEQRRLFDSQSLGKETLPSFDSYRASKIDDNIFLDNEQIICAINSIGGGKNHKETLLKVNSMLEQNIRHEFSSCENDYECFEKFKNFKISILDRIRSTEYGMEYYNKLLEHARDAFWDKSNIDTFDYDNKDIYNSDSIVYDRRFDSHINHILADKVSRFIKNDAVNWDTVYGTILSKDDNSFARKNIIKGFLKQYKDAGMDESDLDYIALISVDKDTLKINYNTLFENLDKYNYKNSNSDIKKLRIFKYIERDADVNKQILKYEEYYADKPRYREIIIGLFAEQILLLLLLIVNNVVRYFVMESPETRDALFYNYIGYVVLMALVAASNIFMMIRADLRISTRYDRFIFGILIINTILGAIAILLSAKITNLIICLIIPIVCIVIRTMPCILFICSNGDKESKKERM